MTGEDFGALFDLLASHPADHRPSAALSRFLEPACNELFRAGPLTRVEASPLPFGQFGDLLFPYRRMGAVDSIDLFGFHELVIFAFYWANRNRYRTCVDIGANLGLHSILMSRCGFTVRAFEPDPIHADLLAANLARNDVTAVDLVRAAVSDVAGETEFVRVKGNTTGSHIAGAKENPYGELDRFPVALRPFDEAVRDADFVKIDAEGHEAVLLGSLPHERWSTLDAIVEIGTRDNAAAVFDAFARTEVGLFSQKIGWRRAESAADLPHSHRDGSLFISMSPEMPWSG